MSKTTKLPPHHSGVRSLVLESQGEPYHPLQNLAQAREHADGVIVFEGDGGGIIYLTVPARRCHCDESRLEKLLADIDALYCQDITMARVFYEAIKAGEGVMGGMDGGCVTDGLWLHPEIEALGIKSGIEAVLEGKNETI